jgi:hypothetical protein
MPTRREELMEQINPVISEATKDSADVGCRAGKKCTRK